MIKFEKFEFIFAIKSPKLRRKGGKHKINVAQNRGLLFYHNYPAKHKIHHVGPSL